MRHRPQLNKLCLTNASPVVSCWIRHCETQSTFLTTPKAIIFVDYSLGLISGSAIGGAQVGATFLDYRLLIVVVLLPYTYRVVQTRIVAGPQIIAHPKGMLNYYHLNFTVNSSISPFAQSFVQYSLTHCGSH